MIVITGIELVGMVAAVAGSILLLSPRERRRQGHLAPFVLALLSVTALLHLLDFLEWRGNESADRLGDMVRVAIPMLWIAIAFDVYRTVRTDESARRIEQFQLILEQTNLRTILVDDRGVIVDCSDSFLAQTARIREELIGKRVKDVGPIPRSTIIGGLKRALESVGPVESTSPESAIWGGQDVELTWTAQRWLDPVTGRPAGASVILELTSDSKAEERETKGIEDESTIAIEIQTEAAVGGRTDSQRATAHDLANFLQIITGQAELLAFDLDYEFRENALSISQAGRTASELVRSLSGAPNHDSMRNRPISVTELVESTVSLLEATLPPNLRLVIENNADDAVILGDRVRLQRVLVNLLLNARDAMPKGGAIVVRVDIRDCEACISVIDEGTGVPAEHREQIFDRYFTTKSPGSGTGLGLSVVREVIEEHGGSIRLAESSTRGSEFAIALPLTVEEHIDF